MHIPESLYSVTVFCVASRNLIEKKGRPVFLLNHSLVLALHVCVCSGQCPGHPMPEWKDWWRAFRMGLCHQHGVCEHVVVVSIHSTWELCSVGFYSPQLSPLRCFYRQWTVLASVPSAVMPRHGEPQGAGVGWGLWLSSQSYPNATFCTIFWAYLSPSPES